MWAFVTGLSGLFGNNGELAVEGDCVVRTREFAREQRMDVIKTMAFMHEIIKE